MTRLALSLLGPFQILLDGQPVSGFAYQKARALLAYLAVEADRPHSRDTLVGLLWPDLPDTAARTNLRQALADLRKVLNDGETQPPFLLVTRDTIQFNPAGAYQLDVQVFSDLLDSCAQHRHRHIERCPACIARTEGALVHYRGDFLAGFMVGDAAPFEAWVVMKREVLHQQAQLALLRLANYYERRQQVERAHTYATRQLWLEPWREEAHQQLMRLYVLQGQRSAALAQYETCRRCLAQELGVAPSAETQALYEQIRAGEQRTQSQGPGATRPGPAFLASFPAPPTPLVGREQELAELGEWLADPAHRLITITGPGGIGKSRLALRTAADHADEFRNGAVFVALAGVTATHFLPHAILAALNVALQGHRLPHDQLRTFLQNQELLLVLDNYEQLLPDVTLISDILHYAPQVTLLVTSRERLALQAEHLYELTGLDYPPSSQTALGAKSAPDLTRYAAIQLFLQRVRQLLPRFSPNGAEMAEIGRICQISEGMPLALELTATLLRDRPIVDIAQQIQQSAQLEANRLRDLPDRHRSMWTVFECSWRLLTPEEQRIFCRLAVFRGGFQAEAAQAIVNSTPELLTALVDKSLLRYQHESPARGRYHLHELLRQYANQKLTESDAHEAIRRDHSAYFLQLAEQTAAELHGPQQKGWLAYLTREHDNLRAALSHCLLQAPDMALQLASALSDFWYFGGYFQEGRSWLGQALARTSSVQTVARGTALIGAGRLAWIQGDFAQATNLAMEALTLFRALADRTHVASALNLLGNIQLFQNELKQARSFFEQALVLRRQSGNQAAFPHIVINLGLVAMYENDYLQAKSLLAESLAISQISQDQIFRAVCLANLGYLELYFGNLREAMPYVRDAVVISLSHGEQETVILCLEGFAEIASAALENQHRLQTAACLFGVAHTFRDRLAIPLPPMDRPFYEASLAKVRTHLSEAAFQAAWAAGCDMSLAEAVAYALGTASVSAPLSER